MKNQKIIFLLLFILILFPIPLVSSPGDVTIIFSNYDLSNTIFMNKIAVQRIFTRKDIRWSNGDSITVFIKPMESIENRMFIADILNMTLYRYQKSLETATYTGKANSVIEVPDDAHMHTAIDAHPGAIGYLNYEIVTHDKIIIICEDDGNCI